MTTFSSTTGIIDGGGGKLLGAAWAVLKQQLGLVCRLSAAAQYCCPLLGYGLTAISSCAGVLGYGLAGWGGRRQAGSGAGMVWLFFDSKHAAPPPMPYSLTSTYACVL